MKKKKREKRKKREKNLPKRLLPASRNSRAISMLRSLPSSSPLSLSWKEILLRKQMRPWIMERVHCLPPLLSLHLCSRLIAYLRVALLNCLVIDAKYIYIYVSLYLFLSIVDFRSLHIFSKNFYEKFITRRRKFYRNIKKKRFHDKSFLLFS